MEFVTSQQTTPFVKSGREDGGCVIEGQAKVARVTVRLIEVRTQGE